MLEKIKCSKKLIGKSQMTSGNAYCVTLSYNGKRCSFTFNDNYLNKSNKNDFVWCMFTDASCYKCNRNIDDFMKEFGYTENYESFKNGIKAYNSCKRMVQRIERLFNEDEEKAIMEELEELGF